MPHTSTQYGLSKDQHQRYTGQFVAYMEGQSPRVLYHTTAQSEMKQWLHKKGFDNVTSFQELDKIPVVTYISPKELTTCYFN